MLNTQVQLFFNYLMYEKKYSFHTIGAYKKDVSDFLTHINPEDESILITDINYQLVRYWITELFNKKQSPKSINRKISSLKSFFKFCHRQNFIAINPMAKITGPKASKRLPVFLDETDTEKLFEQTSFPENFSGIRDKLILNLFYQTGIRRSELTQLKEEAIDLSNLTIKVLGKRNKERLIPISLDLKRNLETYFTVKQETKLDNEALFVSEKNKPLTDQQIYTLVKKYLKEVTLQAKKSPHVLRHTFATHLLNNGADINAVKLLLGHANLSATQIYTHNTIDKLKKSYKQAHPRGE